MLYIFVLWAEIVTTSSSKVVTISARNTKIYKICELAKLQYVFCILQHFANKFWNLSKVLAGNFVFFPAYIKKFVYNANGQSQWPNPCPTNPNPIFKIYIASKGAKILFKHYPYGHTSTAAVYCKRTDSPPRSKPKAALHLMIVSSSIMRAKDGNKTDQRGCRENDICMNVEANLNKGSFHQLPSHMWRVVVNLWWH